VLAKRRGRARERTQQLVGARALCLPSQRSHLDQLSAKGGGSAPAVGQMCNVVT
jgi:hypothetical protein